MDAKEEIKQRLSVEEVIGDYLQLKRAGRNLKATSPFTSEKTPSFMVSPEKQIWHDFSSGKGGDIFTFVMEMEGTDFPGAIEILARRANVDLSKYGKSDGQSWKKKDRIIEANTLAVRYYQECLIKNQPALRYVFKERGYNKQIVGEFGIGYAPQSGDALCNFLTKRGFSAQELKESGLAPSGSSGLRDMFRGRIMIPLFDPQGRTIGFTGRILGDGQPKYLNTPQTIVYDKSGHVFGLFNAKEAIREQKFAVAVEGNLDVVASHMAGVKNVVAIAGTAMTRRHLIQLGRLTPDIRLSFDSDSAGIQATMRAIPLAQETNVSLSLINNNTGLKDPDEIIKVNPATWKKMIGASQYVVDWVIEKLAKENDLTSASGKKKFTDTVLEVISKLNDSVEKNHYIKLLANKLDISELALEEKLQKTSDKASPRLKQKVNNVDTSEKNIFGYQDLLIGMLFRYPEIRDSLSHIKAEEFKSDWCQKAVEYVLKAEHKPIVKVPKELQEYDTYVNIALFRTEELYGDWNSSDLLIEALGLTRRLLKDYQQLQKNKLREAITEAENAGDHALREKLLIQFNKLIQGDNHARN